MKYLSELSPAECLLVLNGTNVPMKELLKYTFLDLVLKRVLKVVEIQKPISSREGTRTYKYIKRGRTFNTYYPMEHEQAFLEAFNKDRDSEILIRHFVRIFFHNTGTETHYKNTLYQYPNIRKYFKKNLFQKLFGGSNSTPARLETAKYIKQEIKDLEQRLPDLFVKDRMQAAMILERIKGNVFLLKDTETSLHEQVEQELAYELRNYMFEA